MTIKLISTSFIKEIKKTTTVYLLLLNFPLGGARLFHIFKLTNFSQLTFYHNLF